MVSAEAAFGVCGSRHRMAWQEGTAVQGPWERSCAGGEHQWHGRACLEHQSYEQAGFKECPRKGQSARGGAGHLRPAPAC